MFDFPIFVNVRDRVRDLRQLVEWLENAGHQRITLIDNASTWRPLLDYLNWVEEGHQVIRLSENLGCRALWKANLAPSDEPFVYTDPDVLPVDECPHDAVQRLWDVLERHSEHRKAALGLHLADVPEDLHCLDWERRLLNPSPGDSWRGQIEPGVYDSLADTTFALHQPGTPHMLPAIRLGYPYEVRHMPWYTTILDAEDEHYLTNATAGPTGSSWAEQFRAAA